MKICMLGAGALGSSIGGVLAQGGSDVVFVDRFQAHVDAINANGLKMRVGEEEKFVKVKTYTSCEGLSPVDLIPDFIPVLGYLDDLVILPALIALTVRLIPPAVWARCRAEAAAGRAGGRKRWFYALPFVLLWLLLAWLIVRAVWL